MSIMIKAAAAAGAQPGQSLGVDTLIAWLLTASIGAYMLSRWIVRGGLRRQRATRDGLAPAVVFAHFGLAITGLAVWVSYLATGWPALAWSAVGVLMVVVGLGVSTVTLLTPYPVQAGPAGLSPPSSPGHTESAGGAPDEDDEDRAVGHVTDEVLGRALTDDVLAGRLVDDLLARVGSGPVRTVRTPRLRPAALIPVGHGVAALATFLLAVLTAASAR
jgi:manganese efflux pump family protein